MKTLGSIVKYKKGKPPKTGPNGRLPVLSPHYLRTGHVEEMADPMPRDVVLKGGELILLWDGSNAGEFFRARTGILSSTMVAFEFDQEEINPDYLYYDLKRFEPELKGRTAGSGIPHVDKELLLGREIFECRPGEQSAAAKVLLKVEQVIQQTEAVLAKQQRIKTGLMLDLLTRGLDAQGRLRDPSTHTFKPSPLGSIPEEWEVNPLRHYLKFISYGFTNPMPETFDGPFLVTAANINNGTIDFTSSRHTSEKAFLMLLTAKSRPVRNDILLTKDGSLGRLAISGGEVICINQSVAILRVNDRVEASFLKRMLEAEKYQALMLADAGGSTIKHLYITRVETLMIAIPGSPDERVRIEKIMRAQDLAVDRLRAEEHKLRRLKSGLMHDLLTGRVPVTPLLANPETRMSS